MLISKTKTEQKRNDGSSTIVLFKRLARRVKQQTPEKRQGDDGQRYTKREFNDWFKTKNEGRFILPNANTSS